MGSADELGKGRGFGGGGGGAVAVESVLPQPVPLGRLGLGNLAVVVALFFGGASMAFSVTLLKAGLGSLITGAMFSPTFLMALTGGIAAAAVMAALRSVAGESVTPLGVSIAGAATHSTIQLAIVSLIWAQSDLLWRWLPVMLTTALIAGTVVGGLSAAVLARLYRAQTGT